MTKPEDRSGVKPITGVLYKLVNVTFTDSDGNTHGSSHFEVGGKKFFSPEIIPQELEGRRIRGIAGPFGDPLMRAEWDIFCSTYAPNGSSWAEDVEVEALDSHGEYREVAKRLLGVAGKTLAGINQIQHPKVRRWGEEYLASRTIPDGKSCENLVYEGDESEKYEDTEFNFEEGAGANNPNQTYSPNSKAVTWNL